MPPIRQGSLEDEDAIDTFVDTGNENNFITSTHVSCDIAKAIRDDFAKNGDEKTNRQITFFEDFQDLSEVGSKYTVIKSRTFSIPVFSGGSMKSFDLMDLSVQDAYKNSGLCTSLTLDEKFSPCTNSLLTEKCVDTVLGSLKVGDSLLCSPDGIIVKDRVYFGNTCPVGAGCTACSVKNLNKLTDFLTLRGSASTHLNLVDSENFTTGHDNVDTYIPPSECTHEKCEPKYRYVLYWNHKKDDANKNKFYRVEVLKVPKEVDMGQVGYGDIATAMATLFTDDYRTSEGGAKYPDLRAKIILKFQPESEMSITSFGDTVKNELNKMNKRTAWNIVYNLDDCKSGNSGCLRIVKVAEVTFQSTGKRTKISAATNYKNNIDELRKNVENDNVPEKAYYAETTSFGNARKLLIKTKSIAQGESLKPGNIYRIVLYDWILKPMEKTDGSKVTFFKPLDTTIEIEKLEESYPTTTTTTTTKPQPMMEGAG